MPPDIKKMTRVTHCSRVTHAGQEEAEQGRTLVVPSLSYMAEVKSDYFS